MQGPEAPGDRRSSGVLPGTHLGSVPRDLQWAWRVWFNPGGMGHTWSLGADTGRTWGLKGSSVHLAENRLGKKSRDLRDERTRQPTPEGRSTGESGLK